MSQEDLDRELLSAARAGNNEKVNTLLTKKWLSKCARVDAKDADGWTALMLSAQENHADTARTLLAKGANVNCTNRNGYTALMIAAQEGFLPIVQILLSKSAQPNVLSGNGATALMSAAQNNHVDIVQALIAQGADPNVKNTEGSTSLILAVFMGHIGVVKALLSASTIDIEAANKNGANALRIAAMNGKSEIVQTLLSSKADINAADQNNNTALTWAAVNGHTTTVQTLLTHGAKIETKDNKGWTALMGAASNGHSATLQALIAGGADLNATNLAGVTPLMLAAGNGHVSSVELLLAAGAKPDIKSNKGTTALSLASMQGYHKIIQLLNNTEKGGPEAVRPETDDNYVEQCLKQSCNDFNECNRSGEIAWKARDLNKAVYWWAQGLHCQESLSTSNYGGSEGSYLYLNYVAEGLGLSECSKAFLMRVDAIRPGMIRLNTETANDLISLARNGKNSSIEQVLGKLVQRYIIPKKTSTATVDPNELRLLIRQLDEVANQSRWADAEKDVKAIERLAELGDPQSIDVLTRVATYGMLIDVTMAAREALEKIKNANR